MARGRKDYEKAMIAVESEGYRDLHGRIIMNEDFENTPFKWIPTGTPTWFVSRQARAAYNGSFGAELDITSSLPPTVRYAAMERRLPIDVTERLELELFWRTNDLSITHHFEIYIDYYDGADRHRTFLQYDLARGLWRYVNDVGIITDIPGSEQTFRDGAWNELSMSIDFAADEHIRMTSNNMRINMGGIPIWVIGNLTGPNVAVAIAAYNDTANQLLVSIDDVVLKELEV